MWDFSQAITIFSSLIKAGLVPILMLCHYTFSIYIKKNSSIRYSKIFQYAEFNLNPRFRNDSKSNEISPKQLIMIFLIASILFVFAIFILLLNNEFFYIIFNLIIGSFLGIFVAINASDIVSILTVRKINSNPDLISGALKISMKYVYFSSKANAFGTLIIVFMLMIFSFNSFLLGVFLGQVVFILSLNKMEADSQKKLEESKKSDKI